MRILVINPNTTQAVTERVAGHVRRIAGPGVEIVTATGRFGAHYIASRAAAAIAGHAALDALAEHGRDCDAVYLACFGDPGLLALRELSPVPVIGMAEAACRAAGDARFGIVTGGAAWKPMLAEFVAAIGLSAKLSGIRTVAADGGAIARDPEAALDALTDACRACAAEDGAETVILGGAGLAGLAERIRPRAPARIVCSVEAGARAAIAAGGGSSRSPRPAPTASVGLGSALADLLATGP